MNKDKQSSVDLYQAAKKIYPRQINGFFAQLRILTVFLLLGFFYVTPWLQWNGHPLVLLDLPERKFHFFSVTFWPQDFVFLTLLLIISALGLFLFTALAGRVWCGYSCPQTVWTETFLWIEQFVEGNRNQRMKLDKSPWNMNKITRKSAKHFLWLTYSLFTGFTFVGYFTPVNQLWAETVNGTMGGWEIFWIGLYSLATYGNAGWLREQVCLYMCPYARFQSAMFDKDTLIISYDKKRGESRGKRKKKSDYKSQGLGDCIDCKQCVQVCPTGIDIRDGLQYECIACAACVDVCDNVMEQMNYPKGLIQYTTEHAEHGKQTKILRTRMKVYIAIFTLIVAVFIYLLATRVPLDVNVIRDRSSLFNENFDGSIENTYQLKILNMSETTQDYKLSIRGIEGASIEGKTRFSIASGGVLTLPLRIKASRRSLSEQSNDIYFEIITTGKDPLRYEAKGKFLGPDPSRKF